MCSQESFNNFNTGDVIRMSLHAELTRATKKTSEECSVRVRFKVTVHSELVNCHIQSCCRIVLGEPVEI